MRNNSNIHKLGHRINAYESIVKNNTKTMTIYREYINFIKSSGYKKSGIEIVAVCEKMLDEAGYLTVKLQNTLEHVFTKALKIKK